MNGGRTPAKPKKKSDQPNSFVENANVNHIKLIVDACVSGSQFGDGLQIRAARLSSDMGLDLAASHLRQIYKLVGITQQRVQNVQFGREITIFDQMRLLDDLKWEVIN